MPHICIYSPLEAGSLLIHFLIYWRVPIRTVWLDSLKKTLAETSASEVPGPQK
jgi:hypothetical protein